MPDMTASVPHQLTRAEAKQRIQDQIGLIRQQHAGMFTSLQESWTGDTLQFSAAAAGQSLSGHLTVDDQMVHLTVHLPWFLRILAGSIRHQLEDAGRRLLKQEKPDGR